MERIETTTMILGFEVGESGTRHIQGYLTLRGNARRLSGMKKLHPRAHWEISRSVAASIKYCQKDGLYRLYKNGVLMESTLPVEQFKTDPDVERIFWRNVPQFHFRL